MKIICIMAIFIHARNIMLSDHGANALRTQSIEFSFESDSLSSCLHTTNWYHSINNNVHIMYNIIYPDSRLLTATAATFQSVCDTHLISQQCFWKYPFHITPVTYHTNNVLHYVYVAGLRRVLRFNKSPYTNIVS